MRTAESPWCAQQVLYANLHDSDDTPIKQMPAGRTQYVLNNFTKKSSHSSSLKLRFRHPVNGPKWKKSTVNQAVRGQDGFDSILPQICPALMHTTEFVWCATSPLCQFL